VNDDEIARTVDFGATLGEQEVGRFVVQPHWVGRWEGDGSVKPEQVVEKRPQSWERARIENRGGRTVSLRGSHGETHTQGLGTFHPLVLQ
jgi:hypothetical protein